MRSEVFRRERAPEGICGIDEIRADVCGIAESRKRVCRRRDFVARGKRRRLRPPVFGRIDEIETVLTKQPGGPEKVEFRRDAFAEVGRFEIVSSLRAHCIQIACVARGGVGLRDRLC